jgi:hypothetical protein
VVVGAGPGSGKTRLVTEMAPETGARNGARPVVAGSQCFGTARPAWPWPASRTGCATRRFRFGERGGARAGPAGRRYSTGWGLRRTLARRAEFPAPGNGGRLQRHRFFEGAGPKPSSTSTVHSLRVPGQPAVVRSGDPGVPSRSSSGCPPRRRFLVVGHLTATTGGGDRALELASWITRMRATTKLTGAQPRPSGARRYRPASPQAIRGPARRGADAAPTAGGPPADSRCTTSTAMAQQPLIPVGGTVAGRGPSPSRPAQSTRAGQPAGAANGRRARRRRRPVTSPWTCSSRPATLEADQRGGKQIDELLATPNSWREQGERLRLLPPTSLSAERSRALWRKQVTPAQDGPRTPCCIRRVHGPAQGHRVA